MCKVSKKNKIQKSSLATKVKWSLNSVLNQLELDQFKVQPNAIIIFDTVLTLPKESKPTGKFVWILKNKAVINTILHCRKDTIVALFC